MKVGKTSAAVIILAMIFSSFAATFSSANSSKTSAFHAAGQTTILSDDFLGTTISITNWMNIAGTDTSGLVGYWKFDEGSGSTVYDNSGSGYNGTISGATWTDGVSGRALNFDGVNDIVTIGNVLNFERTDNWSASAWVKVTSTNSTHGASAIIDKSNSGYDGYTFYVYGSAGYTGQPSVSLINYWYDPQKALVKFSPTRVDDGAWHHIAYTYNGSSSASGMNLYVDGALSNGYTWFDTLTGSIQNNSSLEIGGRGDGFFFNGLIDEVKIYSRVLSASEVLSEYQSYTPSSPATNNSPTASFAFSPTSPTTSDTVQFTDASTDSDGTISSRSWNFGDGSTSTSQNPTHQYSSAGTYAVTLTVTDNGGASSSKSASIAVSSVQTSKKSTSISITPSNFSMQSASSTTLTATLKDQDNNLLAGKTITWSATVGSISALSSTTDSSGQASAAYVAPTVTTQTSVIVTASFAGDSSYNSSSSTSEGTVASGTLTTTSLEISPLSFNISSGSETSITAILFDSSYNRLSGKIINWSATSGSLSSQTTTTDSQGQITLKYTAPTVEIQTSIMIVGTYGGDNTYNFSASISRGTILLPTVADSVENLKAAMERLEIAVTVLTESLDNIRDAISAGKVGASVSIEVEGGSPKLTREFEHEVKVETKNVEVHNKIEIEVSSENENGKTVVVNVDNKAFADLDKAVTEGNAEIQFDNVKIKKADNYEDVLDSTDDGDQAEYLVTKGGKGAQVLVSVPKFSTHTITITTLPTQPFGGIPPIGLVIGALVAIAAVTVGIVWYRIRQAREETTSMLIDHGMSDMRISEAEITREIREVKEFTIPDIMLRSGASKTEVWRTVQKLMKNNLVQQTDQTRPAAGGLGGRGKPSTVYRYVGE